MPLRFCAQGVAIAHALHAPCDDQTPCRHCQNASGPRGVTVSRRCPAC
jgi:hypothetical protein